jgi:hypothetical protein
MKPEQVSLKTTAQNTKIWLLRYSLLFILILSPGRNLKTYQIHPNLESQMSSFRLSANLHRLSQKETMRLHLFLRNNPENLKQQRRTAK